MDIKLQLLATISLGFLLYLQESAAQVIFPGGSFTTQQPLTYTPTIDQYSYGNSYANVAPSIQTNVCICVNSGKCYSGSSYQNVDTGYLDIRIVSTATGTATGSTTPLTSVASSGITPIVQSQSSCPTNLQLCCPSNGFSCGVRYSPYSFAPQVSPPQANYGSFPWQAIILTTSNYYVGAGVLIDHMHVLTVAHKVSPFLTNGIQIKVRMGEWNTATATEPIPYQEFNVIRIFVHPLYNPSTLANTIAILRVSPNVPLGQVPTITTACLSASVVSNLRCWVSGWGAQSFSSQPTQSIQTAVDVPLVDQNTCQNSLRTTRLGSGFVLDTTSFMCAGGEPGKDACTGDGGSPLVCPIAGKWYVIGLVAWGIGCGTTNVPGVYTNVTNYLSWIQSTTVSP